MLVWGWGSWVRSGPPPPFLCVDIDPPVVQCGWWFDGTRDTEGTMNRSEINRALAKAIAFKQCGKHRDAEWWARELVRLLECASILRGENE